MRCGPTVQPKQFKICNTNLHSTPSRNRAASETESPSWLEHSGCLFLCTAFLLRSWLRRRSALSPPHLITSCKPALHPVQHHVSRNARQRPNQGPAASSSSLWAQLLAETALSCLSLLPLPLPACPQCCHAHPHSRVRPCVLSPHLSIG